MRAPKHTPGPWTWVEGERLSHDAPGWVSWSVAPAIVTDCGEPVVEDAESISPANARLIAAAPDFFASAKSLIEAWDARTTGAQQIVTGKSDADLQKQAMDAIEGLRAAIAKATGEPS